MASALSMSNVVDPAVSTPPKPSCINCGALYHDAHMEAAFSAATAALSLGEVAVGCVLIDRATNLVVASGHNRTNRDRHALSHAEFEAVAELENLLHSHPQCSDTNHTQALPVAADLASSSTCLVGGVCTQRHLSSLAQYDLYVTVEPCIMCAAMLRINGIGHVFYGCANPRFGGSGTVLAAHRGAYCSSGGWQAERSIALLQTFYGLENPSAPDHKRRRKEASRNAAETECGSGGIV